MTFWWLFDDDLREREPKEKGTTNSAPKNPEYQLDLAILDECRQLDTHKQSFYSNSSSNLFLLDQKDP